MGAENVGPQGGREIPEEVEGSKEEQPRSLTLHQTHDFPKGYLALNHEKLSMKVLNL